MNSIDSKIDDAVRRQLMQSKVEEAILGSLKQVGVVGISFGLEVRDQGVMSELPETVVISKFSAMGNKVFYHLAVTSQARDIGGVVYILQELVDALKSQAGSEEGPPKTEEVTDLSPGVDLPGQKSSEQEPSPDQETKPSQD